MNWTANTSTSWIYFDASHTSTSITGTGGDNITIYVEPATKPTDPSKGSITIVTENGVIEKEIIRCVPTIVSESKSLSFKINGSDDGSSVVVGPCSNGTASQTDVNSIKITDIVLTTRQMLSEGDDIVTTENLTLNNVDVTYTTENNVTSSVLQANSGKTRSIIVTVTYKSDQSVKSSKTITQEGIKTDSGDYDESKIVDTGYSDVSVDYQDFNFNESCINKQSPSCEGGTFNFSCRGTKVTIYGGKTGRTVCGVDVNIGGGTQNPESISESDISYSCSPSDYGSFNGNVLTYAKNESRTQDRTLNITATLTPANQTVTTTFKVIAGQCGNPLYLHITAASTSVPFSSSTLEIRYYLTESEADGEINVIADEDIISCIEFQCPSGMKSCGTQVKDSNGVYKRTVEFPKNSGEGVYWEFSATCENATTSLKTLKIYQASPYENIIPNCDYFVFRYNWLESDGKDLDSLTHITNTPNLKAKDGTNVSGKTVGFGGTSGYEVDGENSIIYIKHGGDNRCSGAEGAIICLKNILNSGQISNDDIIWVDIYACWYSTRGNGNMNIVYEQFTGLTDGGYSEEIKEVIHDDCSSYTYKTFEPVEGKCMKIAEETTPTINVKAYGNINFKMAQNVNCIDGAYTHVLRLVYKVAAKVTSLEYFTDNGLNLKNMVYYLNVNGEMKTMDYSYTGSTSEQTYNYNNLYIKQELEGSIYNLYPFDSNDDEIQIIEYTREYGGSWNLVQTKYINKSDVESESTYNLSFITDFKITKNADKTINITFKYSEASTEERDFDIKFSKIYGKTIMQCNTLFNPGVMGIYQIP